MQGGTARLSAGYFWYFATLGLFVPYWPPYLAGRGFDPVEIGFAMGVFAGLRVVGPPVYAHFADASGRPLALLRAAALAAAVCALSFPWLGPLWALTLGLAVYSAVWNGVASIYDAYVLARLGAARRRYGQLRLWGSIGFVVVSVAAGQALETIELGLLPFGLALLIGATWLTLRGLPETPLGDAGPATPLGPALGDRRVHAFLVVVFLMLFSHGAYYNFFSIYLEGLGYSGLEIGALWAWAVISEIAIFLAASRLVTRFGLRTLTIAALAATALRWALLGGFADNAALVFAAQTLHMMSFGLFHLCTVSLAQVLFPPGAAARAQALHGSVGFGLGGLCGALVSGWLWREAGPAAAFGVASAAAALATLVAAAGLGRLPPADGAPLVAMR